MTACGEGFRSRNQFESSFDQNNYTGGMNRSGIPFTGFGKMGEMDKIRQLITDGNKDSLHIASFIRWAEIKTDGNKITLDLKLEKPGNSNSRKTFRLSAPLSSKKNDWIEISTKKEFTRSPEKIIDSIGIECLNYGCESAYLVFKDEKGVVLTGAIVKTEKKHVARSQRVNAAGQKTQEMSAFVKSLQVVNGGSFFEAQIPAQTDFPASTISGEVVETNGNCHEVEISSNSSKACLVGNTQEGEIVLMIESNSANGNGSSYFIDLDNNNSALEYASAERLGTTPSTQTQNRLGETVPAHKSTLPQSSPGMMPAHKPVSGASSDSTSTPIAQSEECPFVLEKEVPMLLEYFSDCGRAEINTKIESWWKVPGNANELRKFMDLYKVAFYDAETLKKTKLSQREKDFRTMIGIILEKGFHHLISVVSFIESGFKAEATSPVGAAGFWQIMPQTATHLGLSLQPEDQRRKIKESTRAAMKYLDSLLTDYRLWEGNYKLALAAYNWGQGNVLRNQLRLHGVTSQTPKETKEERISELTMRDVAAYSTDFWKLYEKRMMPTETRRYVVSIISASSILLAPQEYGFEGESIPQ